MNTILVTTRGLLIGGTTLLLIANANLSFLFPYLFHMIRWGRRAITLGVVGAAWLFYDGHDTLGTPALLPLGLIVAAAACALLIEFIPENQDRLAAQAHWIAILMLLGASAAGVLT